MARDVVPVRLSDEERATIQAAADKERVPLSQLVRYAALMLSKHVLRPPERAIAYVEPTPGPDRPQPVERHRVTTYASFADYRASSLYANPVHVISVGGSIREVEEQFRSSCIDADTGRVRAQCELQRFAPPLRVGDVDHDAMGYVSHSTTIAHRPIGPGLSYVSA